MARIETWFNQDLKKAVKVQYVDGNVFSADNQGNLVGVHVFDNGSQAVIGGTVSANIVRADGATVTVNGTLTGNSVYVILPSAAYAIPGPISIVIKLINNSEITTLCAVVANVYMSTTDAVVDPGTIIPSIQALITAINEAVEEIPEDYTDIQKTLLQHNVTQPSSAWAFYYSRGFFNNNLVFDPTNKAVITLKIPFEGPGFVILSSPYNFQPNSINSSYLFTYELEDGSLTRTGVNDSTCKRADATDGNYTMAARSIPNVKYIYILVGATETNDIDVLLNNPIDKTVYSYLEPKGIEVISAANCAHELIFMSDTYISWLTDGGTSITCLWKIVRAGDAFINIPSITGLSYRGSYHAYDNTINVKITTESYTCSKDGIVCIFDHVNNPHGITYIPANRIKLYKADILDLDLSTDNPFDGLNCVAFGTSLTYRSQSTGGFLTYFQQLSGMTIDNQGIGSSKIKGNMLTSIKNYTGYSNKDVALLEGFVNDWGYEGQNLGTWQDNTESTVCGCVRSAINYMLSQNPNMTVFLILDHYGRNYDNVNNSSTAVNSAGDTQFEFYEEIAKVAESLGIPVIKEYAISQISENTPQYLLDNIHCNELGAKQSGYVIWYAVRKYHPNIQSLV